MLRFFKIKDIDTGKIICLIPFDKIENIHSHDSGVRIVASGKWYFIPEVSCEALLTDLESAPGHIKFSGKEVQGVS